MRHRVRVIPACADWFGREAISPMSVRRNVGRSFFHRSVHCGGNMLPMPMHRLSDIRVIEDLDGNRLPLSESQDRAGRGPVIAHSLYDFARSYFQRYGGNPERNVGLIGGLVIGV